MAADRTEITPFLMFEGDAEEALRLYVSLFEDAEIVNLRTYGADGPGPEGTVETATVDLAGQRILFFDSFVHHAFRFTPATSLFVTCVDREQVDRLFTALSDGGEVLMPLDAYPFAQRYGWVNDRFGVSWQLSLPPETSGAAAG